MFGNQTPPAVRAMQVASGYDRRNTPLLLFSQPSSLACNTMGDGACSSDSDNWLLSPTVLSLLGPPTDSTPVPLKPLSVGSLAGTPCGIPSLPLLSPGATPFLGIGLGGLAANDVTGRSLDQVVNVASDPLSLHFVHLNMETMDINEESMDALMDGRFPGRSPWLAPLLGAEDERGGTPPCRHTPQADRLAGRAADGLLAGAGAAVHGSGRSLFRGKRVSLLGCAEDDQEQEQQEQGTYEPFESPPKSRRFSGGGSRRPSLMSDLSNYHMGGPSSGEQYGGSPASRLVVCDEDSGEAYDGGGYGGACGGGDGPGDDEAMEGDGEPRLDLTVSFLEEEGFFDMTLQAAATQLGVGVTTLKKLCRQNGLGRWPYRARCSLRKLRDKMREYFACAPAEERDAADALMGREFSRLARMNVGAIDEAVKQFRQAMFKLEFKARQQVQEARGNGGGRKRPGSAGASDAELNAVIHEDDTIRQQAMLHLRRLLNNCAVETDGS